MMFRFEKNRFRLWNDWLAGLALLTVSMLCAHAALAKPPPAGELIRNIAQATYFNTQLGRHETVFSNAVTSVVRPIVGFELEPGPTVHVPVGGQALFHFATESTSNTPITLQPGLAQVAGDDFDIEQFALFVDDNRDGTINAGERSLGIGDTLLLAPGERVELIVAGRAPGTTTGGDTALFDLTLTELTNGHSEVSRATTIVLESGLGLTKVAELQWAPAQGSPAVIRYELWANNPFQSDVQPYDEIDGKAITIDGRRSAVVLLRDAIPVNTTFRAFDMTGGLQPLYHLKGASEHAYVATPPADLATVDAIAFALRGAFASGLSTRMSFDVTVNSNAGGDLIENTAQGYYYSGSGGGTQTTIDSNRVLTPIPEDGDDSQIYFTTANFIDHITTVRSSSNIYLEINAGICNVSGVIDIVNVVITVPATGDHETVTAIETGVNTGVFRTAAVAVLDQRPAQFENAVVSARAGSEVRAEVECQDQTLTASIYVQHDGVVFDSISNQPVAGATVALRSATGAIIESSVTDANGYYTLDIPTGTFSLLVSGLNEHQFPSTRGPFPTFNRSVHASGSYGNPFVAGPGSSAIDIPVDSESEGILTLEKNALEDVVRLGGIVRYEITVRNARQGPLALSEIVDTLPKGFVYLDGSARLDGAPVGDPQGKPGRVLTFELGTLAPLSKRNLTYAVKVLPSSGLGDRRNTAVARGRFPGATSDISSNRASATVRVDERGGVFAREATVLGKVYLECSGNNTQDHAGEIGIPGVKIILQNGVSVVTDRNGHYSLAGLRPTTHVFSVYQQTLPEGMRVLRSRVRDAGNPRSRFVDLRFGEVRNESFPVGPCTPTAKRQLKDRRAEFKGLDAAERLRDDLPLGESGGVAPRSSRRQGERDTETELYVKENNDGWRARAIENTPDSPRQITVTRKLTTEIRSLSNELGFLDLKNGDVISRSRVSVRIKGRAGTKLALSVNGRTIGRDRIGQLAELASKSVQAAEYVSVRLDPGGNVLEITETDPFGNVRKRRRITIRATGRASVVQLIAPDVASADTNTPVPVVVRILDAAGLLVQERVEVTLKASSGRFDVRDLRKGESGTQIMVSGGEALVDYRPPDLVGTQTLSVRGAMGQASRRIKLAAGSQDRILVGVVEGAFRFGSKGQSLAPYIKKDGLSSFEETTEGVRGGLYLKGKVKGGVLLTMRYNSDADTRDRLFRDVAPDRYYPVYGDASERGYDAQSNGPLFVKIEKGQSYLLYGDIAVEPSSKAVQLGNYRRELTGAHAHYEYGAVTLNLFAARATSSQRIEEVRAGGRSGPYAFNLTGLVDNSEVVELVTRDRDRPGVVLSVNKQARFTDYTIDYFAGSIIFNRPISAADDAFNPVFIRLTGEVDVGGKAYWVYGADARVQVAKGVAVGARETRSDADRGSSDRRIVRSAYIEGKIEGKGGWSVEVAQSIAPDGTKGQAFGGRFDFKSGGRRVAFDVTHTDSKFSAPSSSVTGGRTVARAKVEHEIRDGTVVSAEALYRRDGDETRYGAEGRIKQRVMPGLEIAGGVRGVRLRDEGDGVARDSYEQMVSWNAGVYWRPDWLPELGIKLEYEQGFTSSEHYRVLFGSEYRVNDALRLYADTELTSSDSGVFGLKGRARDYLSTKIGVSYELAEKVTTFSEYRESAQYAGGLALGIQGERKFGDIMVGRLKAEHIEPIGGGERGMAIALGAVHETANKDRIVRGSIEWSRTGDDATWYANQAIGWQPTPSWTVLLRNRFAATTTNDTTSTRDRARIGAAYRPVDTDRWTALAWYEFAYDDGSQNVSETVHSFSLAGTARWTPQLAVRPRFASRYRASKSAAVDTGSILTLGQMGFEYEVSESVSVGVQGSVFIEGSWDGLTAGAGAEVSYALTRDLIATLGYNYTTLADDEVRDIYNEGAYLRLRAKFDGGTWNIFKD